MLQAAQAGSNRDLGLLLETTRDYLLYVANHEFDVRLRQKIGPSDLVQETFVQAQAAFVRFQGSRESDVLRWLRRILLNKISDAQRQLHCSKKRNVAREQSLFGTAQASAGQIADSHSSPSKCAIAKEEEVAIRRLIDRLPEEYQQVIRLRNWERLRFNEIGQRMERSDESARKLWFRAIKRLRQEWIGLHENYTK